MLTKSEQASALKMPQDDEKKLKTVIRHMCHVLVGSILGIQKNGEKYTPDYVITKGAATYFNVQEDSSRIEELREKFWNDHNDKMYCHTDRVNKTLNCRGVTHISKLMMRHTLGSSFHRAIYKYQKRVNPKSNYDMDHVEIIDGERETILDFVNKIVKYPKEYAFLDLKQVRRVQILMRKYGAKRAVELN